MIREKILPKLLLLNTRLVVGTYTAMTLPLYAAFQRPWTVKRVAKAKRTTAHRSADGSYTFWRRHGPPVSHPNGYHTCDSFKEVLQVMRVKEDQNRVRLSQRPVISEKIKVDDKGQPVTQDGKVVKEIQLASEYKWLTLGQVFEKVDNLARGLASVGGVVPREKVIIFADTRLEWFLSALALFELDTVLVTLFSNLGQDGLVHGMKQTGAKHVITSVDLLPRMATFIESTPNIEKIYYIRHDFQKGQIKPADLPKFPPHVQVIPLDEVEEAGKTAQPLNVPLPKVDDVALIMYTSGTTGTPKAVILQNRQLNGALKALTSNVNDLADEAYRHVYASFLPLAHIMGLTFELFLFTGGVRIGYSSPTTLTDTSPAHPPGQLGDLKLLQPTTLITVPLILDRIVKEIYLKISTRSALLPPIVTYLLDYKIRWTKRGFDTPIINRLVCGRVREQFGGKLEFVISGGAPLNPRTEELIRAALNVKLMQGYGLTETTGGIVGMMRQDIDSGKAGYPLDGVSVRLKSWDEGGYTVDDRPNPRGEVLISGDSVGVGYYKLEEETKEAFSVDPSDGTRWFHTGDIGEIYPNGSLKIVDRKKDLAKLPNGEYISLGKIESALKTASLVENACICVSEKLNDIVALVTPNEKMLRVLAAELGKKNLTREQLCADPQVQKAVNKAVTKICASAGLHRRETPVRVHLCAEEWLPDNELLTAAFKLKRRNVLQFYQKEVDALFNQLAASR